jgi:RNA polymerase sigma-70 factor, ECF subfamily
LTRPEPTAQWCIPLHTQAESEGTKCKRPLSCQVDSAAVTDSVADVTGLLQAWSRGDAEALEQLAPLVHLELRGVARRMLSHERQPNGWQPTDLVQESYVRLLDWRVVRWQNRAHFFATTARMMRRVLVDAARARRAVKRGGAVDVASLADLDVAGPEPLVDVVSLEDALIALAAVDPRPSQVVELRFFGGFSVEETAEALGVSVRTVINDWNTARAWLRHELAAGGTR